MTVYQLDEGLRVLRAVAASDDEEKFSAEHLHYRGMANCIIDEDNLKKVGGVERAPMSTTNDRRVAHEYAQLSSQNASRKTLIEFVTEALSTSVSIDFLSVYPREVICRLEPSMHVWQQQYRVFSRRAYYDCIVSLMYAACLLRQVEFLYPPLTRIKLEDVVVVSAKDLLEADRDTAASAQRNDNEQHHVQGPHSPEQTESLFKTAKKLVSIQLL